MQKFISSDRLDKYQHNFQENVTYDNIKSDKKQSFTLFLRQYIF